MSQTTLVWLADEKRCFPSVDNRLVKKEKDAENSSRPSDCFHSGEKGEVLSTMMEYHIYLDKKNNENV